MRRDSASASAASSTCGPPARTTRRDGSTGGSASSAGVERTGSRRPCSRSRSRRSFFRASLGEELRAYAHVNVDTGSYPTSGLAGLDLVEGWVSYRPRLSSSFGLRLRGGHFFPPISLENDGVAWSPTRTLTASALDSWVGEEVRVTGLEASLEFFLPTSDLTFTGAVFGGNDPCGSLLAWRGWAIGDRQSGLSDRLPLAALPTFDPDGIFPAQDPWVAPFREVDGRAGWYAAASYVLPERLEVRTLLYDNRGDPLALENGQYAWKTRFAAVGAKLQLSRGVEVLGQFLDGWSVMGPEEAVDVYYRTWYLLASATRGPHRLSARYDCVPGPGRRPVRRGRPERRGRRRLDRGLVLRVRPADVRPRRASLGRLDASGARARRPSRESPRDARPGRRAGAVLAGGAWGGGPPSRRSLPRERPRVRMAGPPCASSLAETSTDSPARCSSPRSRRSSRSSSSTRRP